GRRHARTMTAAAAATAAAFAFASCGFLCRRRAGCSMYKRRRLCFGRRCIAFFARLARTIVTPLPLLRTPAFATASATTSARAGRLAVGARRDLVAELRAVRR